MPAFVGRSVIHSPSSRARAGGRSAGAPRRSRRMRLRCMLMCPSSMKSARAACSSSGANWPVMLRAPRNIGQQEFRQHHEAEPQRRKQQLGEGADIDHAVGRVGALHRLHRAAEEAVLAVEIVLDDEGVQSARPARSGAGAAPCAWCAERMLAGRRHIDEPRREVRRAARAPSPGRSTWSGTSCAPAATKAACAP